MAKKMSSKIELVLKFFASTRESVGKKKLKKEFKEGITVGEVFETLADEYPGLEDHRDKLILAVNKTRAEEGRTLEDGDEIAFLPPVSGG